MTLVVTPDPERLATDALATLIASGQLPAASSGAAWRRGRVIKAGATPTWFMQVRKVGGQGEQRVAERVRVDVRVWTDGTERTLTELSRAGALVAGWLCEHLRARVVMSPARLPDPADPTKAHLMLTVELLVKGVQE